MKIVLTTDTHLGHDKMVEFCGRPEDHSSQVLDALNILPEYDLLLHLGDVCIGDDLMWHNMFMLNTWNAKKKVLVRGNHDRKSDNWYLSNGWDFVCKRFDNRYFGKRIAFTHKPIADDGTFDINIHGHFHNTDHRRREPELQAIACDKHLLLAIENTDLKPVYLSNFI